MKALSTALRKTTDAITNMAGGRELADYAGTKIAQRKDPSIPQTTSGMDALKSAGKVAGTIGALTGAGSLSKALSRKIPKTIRIPGQRKPIKIKTGGRGREIPQRKTWDEGGW